jgi:hypothetical protein
MPEEGFEPSRDYASRWILSPVHYSFLYSFLKL